MLWIVSRKTCLCIASCRFRATFDRPTKAVFSADGTTAFVLNCGPECGGNQASVSFLPVAGIIIQSGAPVPPGAPSAVTATVPVPGGATNAIANGSLLYLAGQQLQPDGFFAGFLSILDTGAKQVTGAYSIADGTHLKMSFRRRQYAVDRVPALYPGRTLSSGRHHRPGLPHHVQYVHQLGDHD